MSKKQFGFKFPKSPDGKIGPCDTFDYNFKTRPLLYQIIAPIIRIIIKIGWRITVEGEENIPNRNCIFMPNHVSHFDAFLTGVRFKKSPIGIGDEKLLNNKIFYLFMKYINGFPVRKGTKSIAIVDYSVSRVNNGDTMFWFPEGMRHKKPWLNKCNPGKLGSGKFAHEITAPVIPIFISGAEFAMPVGRRLSTGRGLRSIKILVKYGKPVPLDDLRKLPSSKETSQKVVDRIMEAIEELRPPGPYMIQRTR